MRSTDVICSKAPASNIAFGAVKQGGFRESLL